jgi:ABC-type glycerol-3-phosphate transport system substrate-binding protein
MKRLTRRDLLRGVCAWGLGVASATALGACRQRIAPIEKIVEKEVTKVVTAVVRETVVVEGTPRIVEKLITPGPAPRTRTYIVAHVLKQSWTQFAQAMTPAFEEMFPQISLDWRTVDIWQDYPARVAALEASGQLGDLLETPPGALLTRWAQRQLIQPLDEVITADGFDTSGIFQSALDTCSYAGRRMALPFLGHAGENVLLFNKTLFAGAGARLPHADWTLDDLAQASAALTRDRNGDGRPDQFGYAMRFSLPSVYPPLHVFGGELLSFSGRECLLTEPEGLAYLQWVDGLLHKQKIVPTPVQLEGGVLNMFRTGQAAMLCDTLKTFVDLSRLLQGTYEVDAVLLPKHPRTGRMGTLSSSMAYCITHRARNPDDVFQWIKYITGREMGVQMFLGGYADPGCRMASWKDPRILEQYPLCAQIAEAADRAETERLPWNLRVPQCLDAWERGMAPMLYGETTPEACAAQITAEVNRILQQDPEKDA